MCVMFRQPYSELRHMALRAVYENWVSFWPGTNGPVVGYAWRDGGQVPQPWQDALEGLERGDLITIRHQFNPGRCDRSVRVTMTGELQLIDWDLVLSDRRPSRPA
jgi:hypothetical protein